MQDHIKNKALIEKITLAFSATNYPGDDYIIEPSYGDEPLLVHHHFRGQNEWQKLTPEWMDLDGALSFFSDNAFRYYLPAFMIADINAVLQLNDPVVRLCWPLTEQVQSKKIAQSYGSLTIGEKARNCFDAFTPEQAYAIVDYLKYKLEHDKFNFTLQQGLENYWLKRKLLS